jgi:hypothetical protein
MAAWAARNADASQQCATKPSAGYSAVRGDEGFQGAKGILEDRLSPTPPGIQSTSAQVAWPFRCQTSFSRLLSAHVQFPSS